MLSGAQIVRMGPGRARLVLAVIVLFAGGLTVLAMTRTSTTFDEIVLMAGGARGYHTGKFELAPEHPPLMQYLYGLPIFMTSPHYPDEAGATADYRYPYAESFFWKVGNDPRRLAFLGRLPAVLCALLLALLAFSFTRRYYGAGAGLLAATLVAFTPDVLAHGGVAYNDLPLALGYFAAVWALDRTVRDPTPRGAILTGGLVALAVGVKMSALALGPAAVLLVVLEALRRGRDGPWVVRLAGMAALAALVAYLALVAVYRGDLALHEFRDALRFTFLHVSRGHGAAAYLLGKTNPTGWWYFFPVAFLFKTSAGLHLLMVLALAGLLPRMAGGPARRWLATPLRAPLVGAVVFGAALLFSHLDIGFRYALPVLPLLAVMTAVGVLYFWQQARPWGRVLVVVGTLWAVCYPVSYYPNFLAFISEYGPGRDRNYQVLVDSSLDWGQGLVQLHDYLQEHGIQRIYLSYFGSALPEGYGIDYVAAPSFFILNRPLPPGQPQPNVLVVSATNLVGNYFVGDPFARFRPVQPEAVVAGSLYVYRLAVQGAP